MNSQPIAFPRSKNGIHAVEEVAARAKADPIEIVTLGAEGKARLYAWVPDHIAVYGTNLDFLEVTDPATSEGQRLLHRKHLAGLAPVVRGDIVLLELSIDDCAKLKQLGKYHQAVFAAAVRIGQDNEPEVLHPPAISSDFWSYPDLPVFRRFACYAWREPQVTPDLHHPGPPAKIRLTAGSLHILGSDLDHLLSQLAARRNAVPFDDGFVAADYMSQRLVTLNKAAKVFWNPNLAPPTPDTNENVAKWIEDAYPYRNLGPGFGGKLASAFVGVLRDSYADWDQSKYERNKARGELTPFDALVAVSHDWKYADLSEPDTYPTAIADKLMKDYRFSRHRADRAVTLLWPEDAQRRGHLRNEDKDE